MNKWCGLKGLLPNLRRSGRSALEVAIPVLLALNMFSPTVSAESVETPDSGVLQPNWADKTVENVSNYLGDSVTWFDGFFDDERYTEETKAKVLLRLRNDFYYDQSVGGVEYKAKVRARVDLPNFSRKLKLVISGEDDELFSGVGNQYAANGTTKDERSSIGLRYDLTEGLLEHLSLSANMRLKPMELIFKIRHRGLWELDDDLLGRLTSTGYWNTREGFGSKIQFDLEKDLKESRLLRWANQVEWSEEYQDEGVNWSSVVTQYQRLSSKNAISFSAGVNGHSRPDVTPDKYLLRMQYRQNIYRPWLFVEVAPEIFWPKDERRDECTTCFAFLTRLEVVFQKWD